LRESRRSSPGSSAAGRFKVSALSLLLVCLVFAVFSNSLSNDFVFDDVSTIKNNVAITKPEYARLYFTQPFFLVGQPYAGPILYDYYRPLVLVSYLVDYQLWGLAPKGWHFSNLCLHAAAVLLIFALLGMLGLPSGAAFAAAALFAVHPAIADSVASVAGRSDPLCAIFFLSAICLYIGARRTAFPRAAFMLICSSASFVLALLCKENAIAAPLLLAAYELFRPCRNKGRKFHYLIPFFALALAYAFWRSLVVPTSVSFPGEAAGFVLRLMTFAEVGASYALTALFPHRLGFETFSPMAKSLAHPKTLASAVAIGLVLGASVYLSKRFARASFFAVWFLICLVPFSYLLLLHPGKEFFTPPHFLYFPLVGFAGLAACAISSLSDDADSEKRNWYGKAAFGAVALAVVLFSAQTVQRNKVWRDDPTFFSAMVRHAPQSARVRIGLANSLLKEGRPGHALAEYAGARELARAGPEEGPEGPPVSPDAVDEKPSGRLVISNYYAAAALAGMGDAYRAIGESDNSIRSYERAVPENPFDAAIHLKLARAYEGVGRFDEAIESYERALRIDGRLRRAANSLEIARGKKRVYEQAEAVRQKALRSGQADSEESLYSEALIARLSGEPEFSKALLRETLRKNPAHFGANMALGQLLGSGGDWDIALGNFSAAFAFRPTSALAAYESAVATLALRDTLVAEQWAAKAYDLSPDEHYWRFLEEIRKRKEVEASGK